MIKNERQYRITKVQAEKFQRALNDLGEANTAQMHPVERQVYEGAIQSQLDDLLTELADYESLRAGTHNVLEVASFNELPMALIKARIAAGLSQRELADRLNLKEQQIQQYEATEYAAASMSRVQEIINALGILVREEIFLPNALVTKDVLFRRMESIGVDKDFVLKRVLPKKIAAKLVAVDDSSASVNSAVLQSSLYLSKVFDLNAPAIFGNRELQLNKHAIGVARFKLPSKVDERRMSAYTVYAHYIALLSLQVTKEMIPKPIPETYQELRHEIISKYGQLSFETVLRYIWFLGIPVLPLSDSGMFHGACWRSGGRNVIVLKQKVRYPARWLNDALHELCHAGQNPEENERSVIETEDILQSRQDSEEEEEARYFSEDVIFDGRAEEISDECYEQAGTIERLTQIVPTIAKRRGVPVDALAYYIAYSLSLANHNWWGAATNLQDKSFDAWKVSRDIFMEHADFRTLSVTDRELLLQALTSEE
jgi:transcriptional regulator with XRE-family HTH domain